MSNKLNLNRVQMVNLKKVKQKVYAYNWVTHLTKYFLTCICKINTIFDKKLIEKA